MPEDDPQYESYLASVVRQASRTPRLARFAAAPGIVTRAISSHLARQPGLSSKETPTEAVTLIQRFGSALNLNNRNS